MTRTLIGFDSEPKIVDKVWPAPSPLHLAYMQEQAYDCYMNVKNRAACENLRDKRAYIQAHVYNCYMCARNRVNLCVCVWQAKNKMIYDDIFVQDLTAGLGKYSDKKQVCAR